MDKSRIIAGTLGAALVGGTATYAHKIIPPEAQTIVDSAYANAIDNAGNAISNITSEKSAPIQTFTTATEAEKNLLEHSVFVDKYFSEHPENKPDNLKKIIDSINKATGNNIKLAFINHQTLDTNIVGNELKPYIIRDVKNPNNYIVTLNDSAKDYFIAKPEKFASYIEFSLVMKKIGVDINNLNDTSIEELNQKDPKLFQAAAIFLKNETDLSNVKDVLEAAQKGAETDNDNRSKFLEALLQKIEPVKDKECTNQTNAWTQIGCALSEADTANMSPYNAENIKHSFAETLAATRKTPQTNSRIV